MEKELLKNSNEDLLCSSALETYELLNDGEDNLFKNIEEGTNSAQSSNTDKKTKASSTSHEPSSTTWHVTKKLIELKGCSEEAKKQVKKAFEKNSLAQNIVEDLFFNLDQWPSYMVDLFVTKHIGQYSYSDRNKICLFFWGNGARITTLFTFSELLAPRAKLTNTELTNQYNQSLKKCEGLFATYDKERFNPQYSQRYYYYNMIERRMLYIDNRPRHYGIRQEDPMMDRLGIWYNHRT